MKLTVLAFLLLLLLSSCLLLLISCSTPHSTAAQLSPPTQTGAVNAAQVNCPTSGLQGTACYSLDITCPDIPDYTAYVKIIDPPNPPVGTVIFTTGGDGTLLYETFAKYGSVAVNNVVAANYEAVELTWGAPFSDGPGWEHNVNGKGVRTAACRFAMVAQWVNKRAAGLPVCATGNSAGGQNISEGLAHYGLGAVLTFAEITSGPPFNRVDWGCIDNVPPAVEQCSNSNVGMGVGTANAVSFIDPAYPGPWCSSSMPPTQSFVHQQQFLNDSVTSPDGILNYPNTTLRFLYGGQDLSSAIRQGLDYQSKITSTTSVGCVADAPHQMPDVQDAAEMIAQDLIQNCHK